MLILPADAEDAAVDGVTDRIKGIISSHGGDVTKVDKWGRRRLAYEIARQNEGFYAVVTFKSEAEAIRELDRTLSLADEVLRFKVVLRNERAA